MNLRTFSSHMWYIYLFIYLFVYGFKPFGKQKYIKKNNKLQQYYFA